MRRMVVAVDAIHLALEALDRTFPARINELSDGAVRIGLADSDDILICRIRRDIGEVIEVGRHRYRCSL